ncbi:MAG: hypothetical protein EOO65_03515 [Methanosarcinales archaeon]|nr:MAG: hypothetical protein EOO65_03515 [Methanosarcinales archaeon]
MRLADNFLPRFVVHFVERKHTVARIDFHLSSGLADLDRVLVSAARDRSAAASEILRSTVAAMSNFPPSWTYSVLEVVSVTDNAAPQSAVQSRSTGTSCSTPRAVDDDWANFSAHPATSIRGEGGVSLVLPLFPSVTGVTAAHAATVKLSGADVTAEFSASHSVLPSICADEPESASAPFHLPQSITATPQRTVADIWRRSDVAAVKDNWIPRPIPVASNMNSKRRRSFVATAAVPTSTLITSSGGTARVPAVSEGTQGGAVHVAGTSAGASRVEAALSAYGLDILAGLSSSAPTPQPTSARTAVTTIRGHEKASVETADVAVPVASLSDFLRHGTAGSASPAVVFAATSTAAAAPTATASATSASALFAVSSTHSESAAPSTDVDAVVAALLMEFEMKLPNYAFAAA